MVWEECRRICCSRLLWLFLMGSMVVNLWIVWNFQEQQEYVEISRKLAESGVLWLDQENVEEILQAFAGSQGGDPGKIPVQNILEGTLHLIREFAAADLADTYILSRKLQGDAAAYARKVYATLEPVIEENRQDKTARGFFVPCGGRFFDLYSRWLSLALTVESILGSVLLMMRCVNEPFDQRTGAEIYASRLGRRIQAVKGRAAIMVSTGCTVAVWAMTMGMAGVVFPLGKLWDTRLGSMMVLDTFFPLVTRFPVSIRGYLGLQFLVCWCVAYLFRSGCTDTGFSKENGVVFCIAVQSGGLRREGGAVVCQWGQFPVGKRVRGAVRGLLGRGGAWVVPGAKLPFFEGGSVIWKREGLMWERTDISAI